jgi:hypothetical protein
MSDQKTPEFASPSGPGLPDPAREALEKPHLAAEELEQEIGDSEAWDEESQDKDTSAG